MWKKNVIHISKPIQARFLSPGMQLTVSHITIFFFIELVGLYLGMNHGTCHEGRWRVIDFPTFHEVLLVLSKWMVKREELSVLVE